MMSNLERIEDKLAGFEAGADDYVTKPVNPKELLARINALLVRSQYGTPQSARTIAIVGAKGGVGVTSLAVNFAAALVQREYSVTLAELRSGHGAIRFHLNLPAEPNLGRLLETDAESLSRSDVDRCVHRHVSGLRVLLAPEQVAEHLLTPEHMAAIVDALELGSDFLILDLPSLLDGAVASALRAADVILLVTEPESLSAISARMQLRTLKTWQLDSRVSTVAVARVPSGTTMTRLELENELTMGRLERQAGWNEGAIMSVSVIAVIPPEPEAFQEAVRQGVPMVRMEPSARSSRAMAELAEKIATELSVSEAN